MPPEQLARARGAPHVTGVAERWELVAAVAAALLAATYGLGAPLLGARWAPTVPAPELRGALAFALVLTAISGLAWRSNWMAAIARAATILALVFVSGLILRDVMSGTSAAASGRFGPLTGIGLAVGLVCLALTLLPLHMPLRGIEAVAMQCTLAPLWIISGAALCALLPARLLLDWLPLDPGLSWPTTLVMSLLALAATLRVYRQPAIRAFYDAREDRQIFASYLAMLFGGIGLAAMLIAGLVTASAVESAKPMLHRSALGQALALNELIMRVSAAADRGAAAFPFSEGAGADAAARLEWLRELRQQLDPLGQVGIRLVVPGSPALTEGTFHDVAGPQLHLVGQPGMSILDPNGLVLQIERSTAGRADEKLAIQIRPFHAEAQMPSEELFGTSADAMLCADAGAAGAQCLSRGRPSGHVMPLPRRSDDQPWPIQRAWNGGDGVLLLRDPALAAAVVGYAPVGVTGLGVAQKMLLAPLIGRLMGSLPLVLLMLLALGATGAGLLYRRAFPQLQSLRYAKAHIQATLEHLPRGVVTLDAHGRIRTSNAGVQVLSGFSGAQLEGQSVNGLVAAARGEVPWQALPGTSEAILLTASGDGIPVEVLVESFDFEGVRCAVLIIRDLRREQAQRAELARWERIFFHANWGVAAVSDDGLRLELMNPAFASMHGYTVDELKQRPVLDVVAPQSRANLPAHDERAHAQGHHRFESWHMRRDGSIFPVLIDATDVGSADGQRFHVVNVQDMSEQRRAREALQRNEALLQLVLKSLPVGVWIADADGRVVAMNPAVERLWHGPVPLCDGRPVGHRARRVVTGQLVAPDDYPMMRAIRTGEATIGELIEIETADGSRRTLMNAAVPLVNDDGVIQGAIAVNEDLTTMLRAEAAIIAAKNFFESLFDSAALGMAVWDAAGRFERVNQALCELLGREEAALLGMTLVDVGEPGPVAEDLASLGRMRAGEIDKHHVERRWRRGDGRSVWVLVVVSRLRFPGNEQHQFVVQVLDIDRSHRFQQALQASEARLVNAHRIAQLADWEWDPAHDEVLLSEQGRKMLGLPASPSGPVVGADWLARVHPEDRDRVHSALSTALLGRGALAIDYRLVLDDGGERFVHQQGERRAGEAPRLVGVLQDITERKRVENELVLSRQRLRALSANEEELIEQERRHIAREVHDELGQALTALKMELSLLRRRFAANLELAAQAERMSVMVDGTLDVVRHVASNLRPSALDFGLVAAIEWLAEDFGLRWEMPCEVQLDGREVVISDARSTALFRVVQESLTNVARHAHARRVDIRIATDGDSLHLTVRDDGVGFDPAMAQERRGSFGLLGMRERALKIGARLSLRSRLGSGTTIDVELPLSELQEP
ncbi:PAS domain S-box protein [Ideonella azotifigens]|uniref:PAS domain S-box protein n=1 Tax=Ideonella azotifigens TaxID=513160 RepID=A0ABN1KHJ4_9BURK|nr:PAS domain S-box protein [Ideonella azotifigens]MCD2344208.1 PAS domain S-box protein [Ideonella azotifigens]